MVVDGVNVPTVYGYPKATEAAFEAFLDVDFGTANAGDFNIVVTANGSNGSGGTPADGDIPKVTIYPNSYTATGEPTTDDKCRIEYTEATATTGPLIVTAPVVTIDTTGC